ncbi:MAG TPA: penicillin acylase family protein [Gaiellaceae bacterium]
MQRAVGIGVVAALVVAVAAGGAPRRDYAQTALSVLPPGQYGGVDFQRYSTDQIALYDSLTPLFDRVTAADVRKYFKPEPLWRGTEKAVRIEKPGRGVTIRRDTWDVPHVFGPNEAAVFYGAGWAAAEDRGILMELARGPGRLACVDAPGYNAFAVALSGRTFTPSAQTEAFVAKQVRWLAQGGAAGRAELRDLDAYIAGVNAFRHKTQLPVPDWTRTDVIAMTCLLGARFGAGGGEEASRAQLLSALQKQLGTAKGLSVWNDLRELQDPETPTTLAQRFPYGPQAAGAPGPGNAALDDGSQTAPATLGLMSNAILVSAKRSATGRPIMVAGPQLGFFYPEFFFEIDLEGGGVSVRGGSLAGIPNVLIGRGPDYGWSFTSSNSDNIDTFAETLCGGGDTHYLWKGECRAMTRFDAGVVKGTGGSTPVAFSETLHGPVIGYGTVGGRRVALAQARTTRGRELLAALTVYDLSTGRMRSPQQFVRSITAFEMSFNGFYVDSKHIAFASAGRLPVRAPGVDPGLPTVGTGEYDWRGFLPAKAHPNAIDPPSGQIVNWNNKPAPGFASSDENWAYGAVQRVSLLAAPLKPKNTVADVVAAMNKAATQDIRAVTVVPLLPIPPDARDARMMQLLQSWRDAGASRLDRDLDGKIDDPGAAILDALWPKLTDAILRPTLGPVTDRLAQLDPPFDLAMFAGSTRYVDKDLRTIFGKPVQGKFSTQFCGGGAPAQCTAVLSAAIHAAGDELQAVQGPDPATWRADATAERIHFAPGILPNTMRWANRPTFQQVLSFDGHG